MNMEEIVQFMRANREILLYIFVGTLLLIVVIYFIRVVASSGKPKKTIPSIPMTPATKSAQPLQPVTHEQIESYTEKLKSLSLEGRAIIEYLDTEVADRTQRVNEKTRYIEQLSRQELDLQESIKQLDKLPPEVAEKMSQSRIRELENQVKRTRIIMLLVGVLAGLVIAAGGITYYYSQSGSLPW